MIPKRASGLVKNSNLLGDCVRIGIASCFGIFVSAVATTESWAVDRPNNPAREPNPDLPRACGLNVLMILDESGSIGDNDDDVRDAFLAFVEALKNTSSSMAVAEFSKVARLPSLGQNIPRGEYITITDATVPLFEDYIQTYNPGGNTNWDDGLRMGYPGSTFAPRPDFSVPHLTVFITDGDPTRVIRNSRVSDNEYLNKVPLSEDSETSGPDKNEAANIAKYNANALKSQNSHILAIAVGDGVTSDSSLNRIKKISGDDVYPPDRGDPDFGRDFDISTDDIYREEDFDKLKDALRQAAFQLCSPSVTVEKIIDDTPDPDSLGDALPGPNWEITGSVVAPGSGEYAWVLPVQEAPGTGPKTTTTDSSGFATFQWLPTDEVGPSVFTATEVVQSGYSNDQTKTSCTFRTPDTPDESLPIQTLGDGTFTAEIPVESIVTCRFVNLADPAPSIAIEKSTQGIDADTPPGLEIPKGDTVNWEYAIANTGNVTLNNVTVVDEVTVPAAAAGPTVNCPSSSLGPGETMTCTATGVSGTYAGGTTFIGQYANLATVSGQDAFGTVVNADDPSHYFEVQPGIAIEKLTNGIDADTPALGPLIDVGATVTWKYEVKNTGTEILSAVAVTDDQGEIALYKSGDINRDNMLDLNETWIFEATGTAIAGQYANVGEVTGRGVNEVVNDTDPSHYFGVLIGIDIEKSTNGEDADTATGPLIPVGDAVNWTYEVTNTSNVSVTEWFVVDDVLGAVCSNDGSFGGNPTGDPTNFGPLGPGASEVCTLTGSATRGQYTNLAAVEATDPAGGPPARDSDRSHYLGAESSITLEKYTNGVDADTQPQGPAIPRGAAVNWRYILTNTGNVDLTGVAVTDAVTVPSNGPGPAVTCPSSTLAAGASMECSANGVSGTNGATSFSGDYGNLATVDATDPFGAPLQETDPSHYTVAEPGIELEKLTNNADSDLPPGELLEPGVTNIVWEYRVSNTGIVPLENVILNDDQEGAIAGPSSGDNAPVGILDPGEVWIYQANGGTAIDGQYSNLGTVTADPVGGGTAVTDSDPSNYFGVIFGLSIEKSTNGADADFPTGPFIPVGNPVDWAYVVTNNSNIPIASWAVTDNQIGGVSCPNKILIPSESVTCSAKGTAQTGQYSNIGTVSAVNPATGATVEASDPSHYFGEEPSISIEKSTNGQDADVPLPPPLGVAIPRGGPVNWTYDVTNTGNVSLTNITVTDAVTLPADQAGTPVAGIVCPAAMLNPGDTFQCTASGVSGQIDTGGGSVEFDGQYGNLATVTAQDPLGFLLQDTDPSHYVRTVPGIRVSKFTNGQPAPFAPGPRVDIGSTVVWRYEVSNAGGEPLSNVSLVDDQLATAPAFVSGDDNNNGELDLLEIWIYEASGLAVEGQYQNTATASGDGQIETVDDTDVSHYFGVRLEIAIEKSTNGVDADVAPGPEIPVGDPVNWEYVVTNNSNVPVSGWSVVDDQIGTISCPRIILVPGASASCSASGVAVEGQYRNEATVTAQDPAGGPDATDTDPSHYLGAAPALTLEKATNGQDADSPTGPYIESGEPVEWTYVATNTGNIPLRALIVLDTQVAADDIVCPAGEIILDPNESFTCRASSIAEPGQYTNRALVLATPASETPGTLAAIQSTVGATDPSNYFGAEPGIRVEKSTNGLDGDKPLEGALVPIGAPVDWIYQVYNTGNEPLSKVIVTDDQGVVPVFLDGDSNNNGMLDVDEVWVYEALGIAQANLYANIATASAEDSLGFSVTAQDPSHYFGFLGAIDVEKFTNGVDADLAPGPELPIGSVVEWTYLVSNRGTSPLRSIKLTDDQGVLPVFQSGDNGNGTLDIGETWTYSASGVVIDGQYRNLATVEGVDLDNEEVEDTDPSHYYGGTVVLAIDIEKSTNGQDADSAPGPLLTEGSAANFTYVVTNVGSFELNGISVVDDRGVIVTCPSGNPIPMLGVGQSETCTGSAAVQLGGYRNIATAVGTAPDGTMFSDFDPSHHYGFAQSGGGLFPGIDIEKATNGEDSDNPPGRQLEVGSPATFTYVVTNTGNTPLSYVNVSDDQGVTVNCPSGNPIPLLLEGDSIECNGTANVTVGLYRNEGTAQGTGPSNTVLSDMDPSHHEGVADSGKLERIPTLPIAWLIACVVMIVGIGLRVQRR